MGSKKKSLGFGLFIESYILTLKTMFLESSCKQLELLYNSYLLPTSMLCKSQSK